MAGLMQSRFPVDWNSPKIDELVAFLSAITREERKTQKPLYKFVDLGFVNRLASNRNHVIFGRRGSGKSVLLRELETKVIPTKTLTILIDVEQIAQKSYPNLIIEILLIIFRDLHVRTRTGILNKLNIQRRNLAGELETEIRELESLHSRPDEFKQKVKLRDTNEESAKLEEEISIVQKILRLGASLSNRRETEQAIEEEATMRKIGALFNEIKSYRALIKKSLEELSFDCLYILVDDFYQIDLVHQPLIADYLKRLIRGIPCYLKIATVRNRTLLFIRDNLTEAGLQAAHDYTSLELDFSLDDFESAKNFLLTILRNVCSGKLDPLSPDALFESDGIDALNLLTEASGGNPRDFINLLYALITSKQMARVRAPINYQDIVVAVVHYYDKEIRSDLEKTHAHFNLLNSFLKKVIAICQSNNDIGFYVANRDLKNFPVVYSLIGQLADSRFLHLVSPAYDPPESPDKPASVYVVSMGLYSEYLLDKSMNLRSRNLINKPYPKLPAAELSDQFANQAPEFVLIGKTQD